MNTPRPTVEINYEALGRAIAEFASLELYCHLVLHDFWDIPVRDASARTARWPFSQVVKELAIEGERSPYTSDARSEFEKITGELKDIVIERNRVAHTALWLNGGSRGLVALQPHDAAEGVSLTSTRAVDASVARLRERIREAQVSLLPLSEALIQRRRAEGWDR